MRPPRGRRHAARRGPTDRRRCPKARARPRTRKPRLRRTRARRTEQGSRDGLTRGPPSGVSRAEELDAPGVRFPDSRRESASRAFPSRSSVAEREPGRKTRTRNRHQRSVAAYSGGTVWASHPLRVTAGVSVDWYVESGFNRTRVVSAFGACEKSHINRRDRRDRGEKTLVFLGDLCVLRRQTFHFFTGSSAGPDSARV